MKVAYIISQLIQNPTDCSKSVKNRSKRLMINQRIKERIILRVSQNVTDIMVIIMMIFMGNFTDCIRRATWM